MGITTVGMSTAHPNFWSGRSHICGWTTFCFIGKTISPSHTMNRRLNPLYHCLVRYSHNEMLNVGFIVGYCFIYWLVIVVMTFVVLLPYYFLVMIGIHSFFLRFQWHFLAKNGLIGPDWYTITVAGSCGTMSDQGAAYPWALHGAEGGDVRRWMVSLLVNSSGCGFAVTTRNHYRSVSTTGNICVNH